ncbi:DNA (cytosine-5-)-methyltransferase [Arthrobacter rhombi]|uniref:DNA (cytosine-5-)-methyltransferase n=1 Tax=Arthrobacter rhombi TaxID=71253 RepID=UPI003FD35F7A
MQEPLLEHSAFKFIDLFAGLGGFHVAMERLGGECVFASEWNESLRDLYEENFEIYPYGDITKIEESEVPEHDFLCAGFPCQPFSKAGDQLGFEHTEQGKLFFNVLRILEARKPANFLLENVPNLLKHRGGTTIARMLEELTSIGYSVEYRRFSPHQFGIPQVRDRVYIVGSLNSLKEFEWPTVVPGETSIRSVLGHGSVRPLSARVQEVLKVWQEFVVASGETVLPSFPLWAMEFGATYPFEGPTPLKLLDADTRSLDWATGSFGIPLRGMSQPEILESLPSHAKRDGNEFPTWKQDFIRRNREFYVENKHWIDPVLPEIMKFPSSFQKLEWNVKGGKKTLWDHVIQMRASGVRVKRPTTSPSLVAMTDTQVPIIGWEQRYMTPQECSKLQSLGDIALPASDAQAFRALGNAVNAAVVEKIAEALRTETLVRADDAA